MTHTRLQAATRNAVITWADTPPHTLMGLLDWVSTVILHGDLAASESLLTAGTTDHKCKLPNQSLFIARFAIQ